VIERAPFGIGLGRFAIACRQVLDEGTLAVYYEAMADELNAVEWEEFTRWAVREEIFDWIPRKDELMGALLKWRQDKIKRLPGETITPEERAAKQAEIIREANERAVAARGDLAGGLEILKRELRKRGLEIDGNPVKDMP
jgi:hypothetical protein